MRTTTKDFALVLTGCRKWLQRNSPGWTADKISPDGLHGFIGVTAPGEHSPALLLDLHKRRTGLGGEMLTASAIVCCHSTLFEEDHLGEFACPLDALSDGVARIEAKRDEHRLGSNEMAA